MIDLISNERKLYLKNKKKRKSLILLTQFSILFLFIIMWELLAYYEVINPFITSQPSRIINTILDFSSNNLFLHLGVTCYETLVGFLLGTVLRNNYRFFTLVVKICLRCIRAFSYCSTQFTKSRIRSHYYCLGRSWNICNYSYGISYLHYCYYS